MSSPWSRFGIIVLLAAASFVAGPAWVTHGADDPQPAGEGQSDKDSGSDGDTEKTPDGEEEKKGFWSRFKDPEDGKFDIMASGKKGSGIFPLAIPFNEPSIGAGLVLAVAYFHPQKDATPATHRGSKAPPTTTFGAASATTNGTWFAAAGHNHVWKDDTIRYLGVIGGGSINLTFYGFGDSDTSKSDGQEFNLEMAGTVQQVKFRIAESPVFVGAQYVFAATDTTFETSGDVPLSGKADLAGLSGLFEYDTRDTVFTPNKGLRATLELSWFSEALGGDFDYGSVKTKFRYYWAVDKQWTLGFRADYDVVGDDAPFFALSYVKLRGVPAFRYLGNYVVTVEVEPRYKIDERWSVLGFGGVGRAATEFSNLADADKVYGYGAGFRYLLARKLGLGAGIDIARGPEETVGYITIGSAW